MIQLTPEQWNRWNEVMFKNVDLKQRKQIHLYDANLIRSIYCELGKEGFKKMVNDSYIVVLGQESTHLIEKLCQE